MKTPHVPRKKTRDLREALLRRIRFCVGATALCLVSAQFLALVWHPFEWVTHFTPHGALVLVLGAPFLPRFWRVGCLGAGLSLLVFAALPISGGADNHRKQPAPLNILAYNLKFDNAAKADEARFVADADADLVMLIEAGGHAWHDPLQVLKTRYPHACGDNVDGPFALRLLAKRAVRSCEVKFSGMYPFLRAELPDRRVLFALHPPPPADRDMAAARNRYFREAADLVAAEQGPVLVLGDFNNTPFSPLYRRFAASARLRDALPRGLPTWRPFLLALDRVMYRQGRASARALPWRHSDHRPLLVAWQGGDGADAAPESLLPESAKK